MSGTRQQLITDNSSMYCGENEAIQCNQCGYHEADSIYYSRTEHLFLVALRHMTVENTTPAHE